MTIEDLLKSIPTKDSIAHAVGLESQASGSQALLGAFGIFGTGMILGAGLALLLAPKAGQELRHDIVEKVDSLSKQLRAPTPQSVATNQVPST